MPRSVETVVYELPELSRAARERARVWYRTTCLDYEWYDTVFNDFETVCGLLGVTLRTHTVRLTGGGAREAPNIWFRGFSPTRATAPRSTGPTVTPRTLPAPSAATPPNDETLHAIADELQQAQQRNFYQLTALIRQSGRYYHEYSMAIEVERGSPTGQDMTDDAEDAIVEAVRNLARWLYRQLEREYEYLASDAAADEAIADHRWTFTQAGVRFG